MSILEELFYGNLNPSDQTFERKSQYGKAMDVIARNEEILTELLEGKEARRFSDFVNAYDEILGITSVENFITGFQLGARFILDTFIMEPAQIRKDIQ